MDAQKPKLPLQSEGGEDHDFTTDADGLDLTASEVQWVNATLDRVDSMRRLLSRMVALVEGRDSLTFGEKADALGTLADQAREFTEE